MPRISKALLLSILLALAGCNLGVPATTDPVPTTTPINGAVFSTTLGSPRVIAWNPNARSVGWVQPGGVTPLVTDLSERSIVQTCAVAPDQNSAVVYVGGENAQPVLYPLGGGEPRPLGETSGLACTLQRRIQFSPDGVRLAVMQYTGDVSQVNFVVGMLRVITAANGQTVLTLNDVTSYDLYNDGVLFLQLYSGGAGQARTAALRWWDGTQERSIEENIQALEDCQFVAGRSIRLGESVYTLFGERCDNKGSSWRLMRSAFAGGNSVNIQTGQAGGRYFLNAGTNDLWPLPATNDLLIAYPNGLAADVVNLARVSAVDGTVTAVQNSVVIDQHPPSAPRRFVFTPDGNHLAYIRRDGNGAETLYVYSLKTPAEPPQVIAGGNRGDRINAIAWAGDNQRLFYVGQGDLNGLSVYSLGGESKVVLRGVFQNLTLSPDGALAATSEQVRLDARDLRNNLVVITTSTQQKTVLVEGARGDAALTPLVLR
jgi:hypothetical protein